MREMHPHNLAEPSLQATFSAARHFGLSDSEIWRTAGETLCGADGDATVVECLDEISAALARRILHKQRRLLAQKHGG